MRSVRQAAVGVLLVALMVTGVFADGPYTNTSSTTKKQTVTCSGTTTFDPENPVVTTTVVSYTTVTLAPSEHYHPTFSNPVPFCETVTPTATETETQQSTVSVSTATVTATTKVVVTVITTPSPPNFAPPTTTPQAPPVESPPPPPTEASETPVVTSEPPPEPTTAPPRPPPVITVDGTPITLPSVTSATSLVISGVTLTVNPTQAIIGSETTIALPTFTGGAAGLRRGVGAGEVGAWAALAVGGLLVI